MFMENVKRSSFLYFLEKAKLFQKNNNLEFSKKTKTTKQNAGTMAGQSKLEDIGPAIFVFWLFGKLEVFYTLPEKPKLIKC